jgi:hypothetical protein
MLGCQVLLSDFSIRWGSQDVNRKKVRSAILPTPCARTIW